MASFRPALTEARRHNQPPAGRPVNSGPRPCLFDDGFPLSGLQVRTYTSDLNVRAQHTRSGRRYRTPVLAFKRGATLSIGILYGEESDWVRNVLARGGEVDELARYLEVTDGELAWLADARGLERTVLDERLRHYRYAALARPAGPPRVIEAPKSRLKAIQRRVAHEILDWIPAHDAAHGFTRGRSVLSHAAEHTGRRVVMGLDLQNFFASIPARRVFGIFRTAGYSESVAHALTALTTNVVSLPAWQDIPRPTEAHQVDSHHQLGRLLATPHLPQGAPTSPSLANLAAFRLDRRLSGLAASLMLTYTRYADDLTFSGPERLLRISGDLRRTIAAIAREEGFAINHRKSTLATRAGRQQVCGIVVNEHVNVARADYDTLKAILHNAGGRGPGRENRASVSDFRAHLLGRIAWMSSLNPQRGETLRRRFARIHWEDGG